ncbi:MAG: hypothetical protein ACRDKE_04390, partial [Solirubrobacterales bacterium]
MQIRTRRIALFAACAAFCVVGFGTVAMPAEAATVFKGRFGCAKDNRPIVGARVELTTFKWGAMGKFPTNLQVIGSMQTDKNGSWGFSVSGEETEIFARIVLSSRETEIRAGLAPWNHWADTADHQNDVPEHDYGLQMMRGYECGLYNSFRNAELAYEQTTGERAPQGEVVVRAGPPTGGVPFSFYDVVWWPSGYPVKHGEISVPAHEFAHTFRHRFDGSESHFYTDVAGYGYPRRHSAEKCDATNSGFAFNEGWAEYWSGDVRAPCADALNPNIERNVAAELKRMETRCRLSRPQMVGVLRANQGRIHSIAEFGDRALCSRKWGPLDSAPDSSAKRRLDAIKRAEAGRSWQKSQDAVISGLRAALRASRRAAKKVGGGTTPCVLRTCARIAERRMRPVFDAGKLEQARVGLKAFKFLATRKQQLRLSPSAVVRKTRASQKMVERQTRSIAVETLTDAGRALRGLGKSEEIAELRASLRDARVATRSGKSVELQNLSTSTGLSIVGRGGKTDASVPLVEVVVGQVPAIQRAPSTLTINGTCDGSGLFYPDGADNTAKVSGQ